MSKHKHIKKGNNMVPCSSVQPSNMYKVLHLATMFYY